MQEDSYSYTVHTSPITSYNISISKSGYTPIYYHMEYGWGVDILVSLESTTYENGKLSGILYIKALDNDHSISLIIRTLWFKNK